MRSLSSFSAIEFSRAISPSFIEAGWDCRGDVRPAEPLLAAAPTSDGDGFCTSAKFSQVAFRYIRLAC